MMPFKNFSLFALLAVFSWQVFAGESSVEFRKQYLDGPYGQIHVLSSIPNNALELKTPMACFAPNPASGNYFRMFMEVLGSDRVMIAPDYPGLGESDPPAEIPDMAGYAHAMAAVLDAMGYGIDESGQVDICGYHTGAMVAIELAIMRPDLVRRVVLLGVPFYTGEERQAQYDKNVVEKPIAGNLDDLRGSWDFAVTDREEGVTLRRGYENFVDVLKAEDRRHYAYSAVFTYPAEKRAPLVQQAVLVLNTHGSLEVETRAIAPLFLNATLVEIPELHHGIFDVGPDLLAAKARPFLDQP
jgi:pimeloyl-ACP methyl ester carboxylesterase